MNLISVVRNDKAPPCVVAEIKKAGLTGIGVLTWCGKERDAGGGIMQVPAISNTCDRCQRTLAAYENKLREATTITITSPSAGDASGTTHG